MNKDEVIGGINVDAILSLLQDSFHLVLVAVFVIGSVVFLVSFLQFKNVHSVNYRGGQGVSVITPLMGLIVGVFLMYYPTTVNMLDMTILGQSNPLDPYGNRSSTQGLNNNMWRAIDMLYKLFGTVAIIKGILLLRKIGEPQHNPNEGSAIGKSLGFIIFGYAAFKHEVFFSMIGDYIPILKNFAAPITQGFGINY